MLTDNKNLRTGKPVWMDYGVPRILHEELTTNKACDVVIIGTGISGAMVAEELSLHGLKIIMLDSRAPLKGSTVASTALLQFELDEPLISLTGKIGKEKAIRAWRRSKLGLESLAAKIQSLDIDCDYVRRPALYLAGNELGKKELFTELSARKNAGLYSEYLTKKELKEKYGITRKAALKSYDNISANPQKLAAALLKEVTNKGGKIYAPVEAAGLKHFKNHINVKTKEGFIIKAKYVVFATGYEVPKYIDERKYKITSTWAIATKPQKKNLWTDECFVWEATTPYIYLRTTADGRVVCGGEDEEFEDEEKRDALIPQKTKKLEAKLKKLFPKLDVKAEFAWAGSFGESPTSLPLIGKLPGLKNCYAIMGLGGNGITFSRIGAEVITADITGKPDPDADLFKIS